MIHQDRVFMRTFLSVLIGLGVLAVIFLFVARGLSGLIGGGGGGGNSMAQEAVEKRIAPVGQVAVAGAAAATGTAGSGADTGPARSGEQVVQATCASCHDTGVAGAPKIGDKDAWAQRADKGMEGMLEIAVNGKGAMPPRGGGDYNEQELRAAIEYMLAETGVEAGGGGGQASAAQAPSQAPTQAGGDTGQGKALYQQVCASCHNTGVAGAPTLDDSAAWSQRAEKGIDAMVEVAVKGKGAMPPRGGSGASDAELRAVIEYMLQESGAR